MFWIQSSDVTSFDQNVRELALLLGVNKDARATVYDTLLAVKRELLRFEKFDLEYLIVLDDVNDSEFLFEKELREGGHSSQEPHLKARIDFLLEHEKIMVTSRHNDAAHKLSCDITKVAAMTVQDALKLLDRKLKHDKQGDARSRVVLVKLLGRLPLAISQAAAYINAFYPEYTLNDYIMDLKKEQPRLRLLSKRFPEVRQYKEDITPVLLTWHVSFTYLKEKFQSASKLLSILCFYDCKRIPDVLYRSRRLDESRSWQAKGLIDHLKH